MKESGFVLSVRTAPRRLYAVEAAPVREVGSWLERFRRFWSQRLDALAAELARGKGDRRGQRDNDESVNEEDS